MVQGENKIDNTDFISMWRREVLYFSLDVASNMAILSHFRVEIMLQKSVGTSLRDSVVNRTLNPTNYQDCKM